VIRKVNNTTQDVTTYEWDHRNRLISVLEQTTNTRIEYQYDPLNRLVSRYNPTGAGQSTRQYWVYDEGINPVLEFSSSVSSDPTHRYLWSNEVDELLADEQISGGGSNTLWGLADHLGTIRDIADRNETTGVTSVVNHRRYDTYGNRLSQSGPSEISFGYTGKYFDETTRLQNNYSRWYDPRLGKWISQDPIGFAAGDANLYRYVGNSPTMATDPSGLETWWEKIFGRSNSLGDPYMDQYAATLVPELGISSTGGMSTEIAFADPIWDERRKTFSWTTWVDPEYMADLWYQEGEDYLWGRERSVESRRMTNPDRPLGGSIGPIGPMRGASAAKALTSVGTAPSTGLFRGGSSLQARLGVDVKAAADGLIHPLAKNGKPQGLSVNIDRLDKWVQDKGGAFPVNSLPEGLQALQSGKPGHFVIAPKTPITLEEFQRLLNQVKLGDFNVLP
jgi:RHS repeat-associated protein